MTYHRAVFIKDRRFWDEVEYAATRWLAHSDQAKLRSFWIDGFLPEKLENTKFGDDVSGSVWMGNDPTKTYYFIVSVPQKLLSRSAKAFIIEWIRIIKAERFVEIQISYNARQAISPS